MKRGDEEGLGMSGITYPKGFQAAGVSCGIKESGLKDLAVIFSEKRASGAAVYTTNRFKAAPLLVTEEHLADGALQAVVCNSGNANCCTGPQGLEDARAMARETARLLHIPESDVAVASTGVIGVPLPMENVLQGIDRAVRRLSHGGGKDAAEAILTTDTRIKEFTLEGEGYRLGAMAKGAGMIAPDMATMLCFITTDALVDEVTLRRCLKQAVESTFNMITVDGCTSTNDMVLVLANGISAVRPSESDLRGQLLEICGELAMMLVKDGEGATRFIEVKVTRAMSAEDAKRAAMSVGNSLLVKTAFYGGDPNWGRIMAALGSSGVHLDTGKVTLTLNGTRLVERGEPYRDMENFTSEMSLGEHILVEIDLGVGAEEARIWASDISEEYVRINAKYTT